MQPQQFHFGAQPWPDGAGVLQIYAPVSLELNPELAILISQCRAVTQGAPVTEVEDAFLHLTLDVIADVTAEHIPQVERDVLDAALRKRLADVPVVYASAGSPLAYATGVILDVGDAAPLRGLQYAVREVIGDVRGPAACTWQQSKPHVSLSYCHTPCDSDPWARKVRQVDPNHAPLTIDSASLVEVRPDNATKALEWTAVAPPIPLAGADRP